jgi:hypothetical protein
MARGDQARIKGAQQGRQNVVFYRNTALLTNANGSATSQAINFPTRVVDLKSTIIDPTTNWKFVSPRSRFYRVSLWVELTSDDEVFYSTSSTGGIYDSLVPPAFGKSYTVRTFLDSAEITTSLVGQVGRLTYATSKALVFDMSGNYYIYYNWLVSAASAHVEGVVFVPAGSTLSFTHTYNFGMTPLYLGTPDPLNVDAKASVEITEVTPEQ